MLISMLALLGVLVGITVSAIWKGYALSILWVWFAVPFGLPVLGLAQAMGVSLLIAFLTYQFIDTQKEEKSLSSKLADSTLMAIVYPLMVLGIGWVIKQFL